MTLSAAFTVDGAANPAAHATTYGATVTLARTSTQGTATWSILSGSYPDMTLPTLTVAAGSNSATFPMVADPGDGLGRAILLSCSVFDGRTTAVEYAVIGVLNGSGILPICVGEDTARHATYGWVGPVNQALASLASGGGSVRTNTFFVDCNAASSGDGSLARPYKTITAALAAATTTQPLVLFLFPPVTGAYDSESALSYTSTNHLSIEALGITHAGGVENLIDLPQLTKSGTGSLNLKGVSFAAAVQASVDTYAERSHFASTLRSTGGNIELFKCQADATVWGLNLTADSSFFSGSGTVLKSDGTSVKLIDCQFGSGTIDITFTDTEGNGEVQMDALTNYFWKAATESIAFGHKTITGDLAA